MSRARGTITRRGRISWRIKYDAGVNAATGERKTRYVTIKGTRQAAQKEYSEMLARLGVSEADVQAFF